MRLSRPSAVLLPSRCSSKAAASRRRRRRSVMESHARSSRWTLRCARISRSKASSNAIRAPRSARSSVSSLHVVHHSGRSARKSEAGSRPNPSVGEDESCDRNANHKETSRESGSSFLYDRKCYTHKMISPPSDNESPDIDFEHEDELGSVGALKAKMQKLRDELAEAKKERGEYLDGWQRAKADLVNAKRDFAQASQG